MDNQRRSPEAASCSLDIGEDTSRPPRLLCRDRLAFPKPLLEMLYKLSPMPQPQQVLDDTPFEHNILVEENPIDGVILQRMLDVADLLA